MTDDVDSRLRALLLAGAPPERDPLFRIRVLERRERERYRRQSRGVVVGAAVVLGCHAVALALAPDVLTAAIGAVAGLVLLGAGALSVASLLQVLRAVSR
jgi:hypothetical protein